MQSEAGSTASANIEMWADNQVDSSQASQVVYGLAVLYTSRSKEIYKFNNPSSGDSWRKQMMIFEVKMDMADVAGCYTFTIHAIDIVQTNYSPEWFFVDIF